MRIPFIDKYVENGLNSQPDKIKYFLEKEIHIKKGERTGKVEVPANINVSAFELIFPSGLTYLYGDSETEEESKEVKFKRDPELSITLPDISDKDMVVPLKFGFDYNPKNKLIAALPSLVMLIPLIFYNLINLFEILQFNTSAIISTIVIDAMFIFIELVFFREYQITQRLWDKEEIKKKEKTE